MQSPLDNLSAEAIPFEEEQAISLRNGFGLLALALVALIVMVLASLVKSGLPHEITVSWLISVVAGAVMVCLLIASFRSFAIAEEYTEAADLRGSWVCIGISALAFILVISVGDTPATQRVMMFGALAAFIVFFGFYLQRRASLTMPSLASATWYLAALGVAAIPLGSAFLIACGNLENDELNRLSQSVSAFETAILGCVFAFLVVSIGFFGVVWNFLSNQISLGLWRRRTEIIESTPRGAASIADLYRALGLGRRPPAA